MKSHRPTHQLIGNYRNGGTDYRPKGDPRRVKVHDFEDNELGKVVPYGVYDVGANAGWVSVGIASDTAEFAVASIRPGEIWPAESNVCECVGKFEQPEGVSNVAPALSNDPCNVRVRIAVVSSQPGVTSGLFQSVRAVSERIESVGGFPNRLISASSFTLREWGRRGWVFPTIFASAWLRRWSWAGCRAIRRPRISK